jgi:hypothetical protein
MVLRKAPRSTVVRFDRDASTLSPNRFVSGEPRIRAPMFGLATWPQMIPCNHHFPRLISL